MFGRAGGYWGQKGYMDEEPQKASLQKVLEAFEVSAGSLENMVSISCNAPKE